MYTFQVAERAPSRLSPLPSLDSSLYSEPSSVSDGKAFAMSVSNTCGNNSTIECSDEYFASRGASACSGLLHTMWQIDERIIEPPKFTFDLCPSMIYSSSRHAPTNQHRPSYACTAKLILNHDRAKPEVKQQNDNLHHRINLSDRGIEEITSVETSVIERSKAPQ